MPTHIIFTTIIKNAGINSRSKYITKLYPALNHNTLQSLLGNTDIYLIDQILKNRYNENDLILDAGCGGGRNLHWFLQNNMLIYGTDIQKEAILQMQLAHPSLPKERLLITPVERMPFAANYFDHIISSAVLHFATSKFHFMQMMAEMVRVLKPEGTIFIRMTADIGIQNRVHEIADGVYEIPDGSIRFLLTKKLLAEMMQQFHLDFTEPLKTVNVDDVRCMSTLMLQKRN